MKYLWVVTGRGTYGFPADTEYQASNGILYVYPFLDQDRTRRIVIQFSLANVDYWLIAETHVL